MTTTAIEVPVEVLGAAWRMVEKERVDSVIEVLEGAALLKRGRPGCVQLHDLAWEYARAVGGGAAAHSNAVDRWRGAFAEGGAWWAMKKGVGAETGLYAGAQLLRHLREAGRGAEATEVVWKLQWLIYAVKVRGGAALTSEVGSQLVWERGSH